MTKAELYIDGKLIPAENIRVEITTQNKIVSPTGRIPRLYWSEKWQEQWQRAAKEEHPWFLRLKKAVDNIEYYDKELFPTVLYQITGDSRYAFQAIAKMNEKANPARIPDSDGLRENFLKWIIMYEWLYPAFTDEERNNFAAFLDRCCLQAAKVSLSDSDKTVGYYFAIAVWARLSLSIVASSVLDNAIYGGIVLTDDPAIRTARTQLSLWAKYAEGGEWIEGTDYNKGTTQTLVQGLKCLRDLGVSLEYQDLWAIVSDLAAAAYYRVTNDDFKEYMWGAAQDENEPHELMGLWASLSGVANDGYLKDFLIQGWEKGGKWQEPRAEFYLDAEPYYLDLYLPERPPFHKINGQQMLYSHNDEKGTFVIFRVGRNNGVDHPTFDSGNFKVWRNGEWVINHPMYYDDLGNVDGRGGTNTLLLGNQPAVFKTRLLEKIEPHRIRLRNSGSWYYGDSIEYVHYHIRTLIWVEGDTWDCIVVRDQLNITQPTNQTAKAKAYNRGSARLRHKEYIDGGIPLVQWVLHSPIRPNVFTTGFGWDTDRNKVDVKILLPNGYRHDYVDEKELFFDMSFASFKERERKWQTRISPVVDNGLVELLNVITIYDRIIPECILDPNNLLWIDNKNVVL